MAVRSIDPKSRTVGPMRSFLANRSLVVVAALGAIYGLVAQVSGLPVLGILVGSFGMGVLYGARVHRS